MAAAPFGLAPVNAQSLKTREYYIPQSDTSAYAVGDLVALATGFTNGRLPNGQISIGAPYLVKWALGLIPCGVLVGVQASFPGQGSTTIPATKQGAYTVVVCDDPLAEFFVEANNTAALSQTVVGGSFDLTVAAPTGSVSGSYLDVSTIGGTITVLNADTVGTYARLRVRLRNHAFASTPSASIEVPASKWGVYGDTGLDMTTQVTTAVNAAAAQNFEVIWPPGEIRITGTIAVIPTTTVTQTDQTGSVIWAFPIHWRGAGAAITKFLQMTPSVPCFRFYSANGNTLNIRFSDFSIFNNTASITDVYQTGIQIGGGLAPYLNGLVYIHNVGGWNLYSLFRLDDATSVFVSGQPFYLRVRYYMEGGYNSDCFKFFDFNGGGPVLRDIGCTAITISNGTITGIAALATAQLLPGMGCTFSGCAVDTIVQTVGATSITVLPVPTAGGATALTFHTATLLSVCSTGSGYAGSGLATVANATVAGLSPWYWGNTGSSPNCASFENVLWSDCRQIVEDYAGVYGLRMHQIYMERPMKIATLGTNNAGANRGYAIDGIFISQGSSIRQPALEFKGTEPEGYVRNVTSDGSINSQLFDFTNALNAGSGGNKAMVLEGNLISTVNGSPTSGGYAGLWPQNGTVMRLGGESPGNMFYKATGLTQTIDWLGCDGYEIPATVAGNVVIQNAGSVWPTDNRVVFIRRISSAAGETVAYSGGWVDGAGGVISASAASSAANQVFYDQFLKLPGRNVMKRIGPTPAWG